MPIGDSLPKLRKYRVNKKQITVISFSPSMLKNFNKKVQGFKSNLLLSCGKKNQKLISAEDLIEKLKDYGVTGVSICVPQTVNADYIKKVKDAGFEFHVWTIDNPAAAARLKNMGVDSITTNVPVRIRKALAE